MNNKHAIYIVSPTEKRNNQSTEYLVKENYSILKVKTGNIQKTNRIEKGISTLLIETQFKSAIKKYFANIKFDLIVYATPPITFSKVVKAIKKRDHAKSYLLLKDIFPQNAVDLQMFSEKGIINRYFRQKEKQLYQISDYIGCMSQANVDYILKHNTFINADSVEICPNSIEVVDIQVKGKRQIREKYNIPQDKKIFVYGGNLGKPQGIDHLCACLEKCRKIEDAFFIVVGSGTEFKKLETFIKHQKLPNVRLLSQLPKTDYESLVVTCDVGLIFLDKRFTIPNFPSRLLSYMQAAMPMIACTDVNTDIGKTIEAGHFGYWCESKEPQDFKECVEKMCTSTDLKEMGQKARNYLEEHYTVEQSYQIIMKHFKEQ
ncbi:MAG: glycosyltransferase family 4 protein [Eubacterium sp.]